MIKNNPDRFASSETPFAIADLGCADGTNSVPIFDLVISLIREMNPDFPINIFLNDTPSNDFSLAMKKVSSALEKYAKVWIYSSGKSFYEELFPENSIDLMISNSAVHWLPRSPGVISSISCMLTEEVAETAEGKVWEKEAAKYWEQFLRLRQKELRTGGRLLITAPAISDPPSEDDIKLINQAAGWKSCFLKALEKFDLKCDKDYNVPAVIRPLKYYKRVFDEKKTELQLIDSFIITHEQIEPTNNPEVYSSRYVNWVRAIIAEILKSKMIQKGISEDLASKVLDEFCYKELTQYILQSDVPQKPLKVIFAGLEIKK